MRKDHDAPHGSVHTLWIDSDCLKGNLLGDPSRRRVDVYVPAGLDGRGLPLLVDLVGYTGGGPGHTNWKNYGENVPERLDRLIASGAMPQNEASCANGEPGPHLSQFVQPGRGGRWALSGG